MNEIRDMQKPCIVCGVIGNSPHEEWCRLSKPAVHEPAEDSRGCNPEGIETYSGKSLDVFEPDSRMVDPYTLSHSLATVNRFGGQAAFPFSVAQHSLNVLTEVRRRGAPLHVHPVALLHDAHEAYTGDMVLPIKLRVAREYPPYIEMCKRVQRAVLDRFGFDCTVEEYKTWIKAADKACLKAEAFELMPSRGENWNWGNVRSSLVEVREENWRDVRELFYATLQDLIMKARVANG